MRTKQKLPGSPVANRFCPSTLPQKPAKVSEKSNRHLAISRYFPAKVMGKPARIRAASFLPNESESKPGIKMVDPEPCFRKYKGVPPKWTIDHRLLTLSELVDWLQTELKTVTLSLWFSCTNQHLNIADLPVFKEQASSLQTRSGSGLNQFYPHPAFGSWTFGHRLPEGWTPWSTLSWKFRLASTKAGGYRDKHRIRQAEARKALLRGC